MTKKKKKSWASLEYWSLGISFLALIFSIWSYYNSSIRIVRNLEILSINGGQKGDSSFVIHAPGNTPKEISIDLVFANRGTQSEVILDQFILKQEADTLHKPNPMNWVVIDRKSSTGSFIIKPGEVKMINTKSTIGGLYGYYTVFLECHFLDKKGHHVYVTENIGSIYVEDSRLVIEAMHRTSIKLLERSDASISL